MIIYDHHNVGRRLQKKKTGGTVTKIVFFWAAIFTFNPKETNGKKHSSRPPGGQQELPCRPSPAASPSSRQHPVSIHPGIVVYLKSGLGPKACGTRIHRGIVVYLKSGLGPRACGIRVHGEIVVYLKSGLGPRAGGIRVHRGIVVYLKPGLGQVSRFRIHLSEFGFQKFQVSDSKLHVPNFRLQISYLRFQIRIQSSCFTFPNSGF